MKRLLALLLCLIPLLVQAQTVPPNARVYLPSLKKAIQDKWPSLYPRSSLAAQVEQESCVSLRSRRCWNPHVELKTSREYGFGLGQLTVTSRFNKWKEVKRMDRGLNSWRWSDRFNAYYQLRAIVDIDQHDFNQMKFAANNWQRMAFTFSSYNGGFGGVLKDRKLCEHIRGCNPNVWFNNVEVHSWKSRISATGYGQSFFQINRGYVKNVLYVRRPKYVPYLGN